MTVMLFIVDTSASMAQKSYQGVSALDLAKSFVDAMLKQRSKDVSKMFDRYMLMTTEDFPMCLKVQRSHFRDGNPVIQEHLKLLKAKGRNSLHNTIINAFRFLNLYRMNTGVDNYGFGRFASYLEPVVIVCLTDGLAASEITKDHELRFVGKHSHGSELTKEAYRWDQRLFTVVFRAASLPSRNGGKPDIDSPHIERICAQTGGRSFNVSNSRQFSPCVEQIIQAFQTTSIGIRFDCPALQNIRVPADADNSQSSDEIAPEVKLKKRLEVRPLSLLTIRSLGGRATTNHWPIPEAFWYERIDGSLPARRSHPAIVFSLEPSVSQVLTDFPFDKYELEPCPVADFVLNKYQKSNPNLCFQVFVHNSGKQEGYGKPFGFLKAASNVQSVNLFIMPYNYPFLMQLLEESKADNAARSKVPWRQKLDKYVESVPPYYINSLRKHLQKLKINGGLLDDQVILNNPVYTNSILSYLNKIKQQGKEEYDRTNSIIAAQNMSAQALPVDTVTVERRVRVPLRKNWRIELVEKKREYRSERRGEREKGRDPRYPEKDGDEMFSDPAVGLIDQIMEKTQVLIHVNESRIRSIGSTSFRNPFILRKTDLVEQIPKMRANMDLVVGSNWVNVLQGGLPGTSIKLHQAEELHSLPVARMGVFEEYVKALEAIGKGPLREVEPAPARAQAFGNPYKLDKKNMAIDEVGEGPPVLSPSKEARKERKNPQDGRPPKRKAGPLSLNAMQMWRDKRKTLSTCSSVVSDMSFTSDLDDEVLPSSSEPKVNGFSNLHIGNGSGSDLSQSAINKNVEDNWGLDEEAESEDEIERPPKKKLKTNGSLTSTYLSDEKLNDRKIKLAAIIRRLKNGRVLIDDITRQTRCTCTEDEIQLTQFALREAIRFKRKSVIDVLDKSLTRLIKLHNISR